MDPLTAALNLATEAVKAWTVFYQSLTPQQRETYNQPFVDGMKEWGEIVKHLSALIQKP